MCADCERAMAAIRQSNAEEEKQDAKGGKMVDETLLEIMRDVVLDDAFTVDQRKYALSTLEGGRIQKEASEATIRMVADNGLRVGIKTVYRYTVRSAANFMEKRQKIYAIKILRDATKQSLRECKDAAEVLAFRCGF